MHHSWKALIATVFLLNATVFGQNLVMNPSFEDVNVGSLNCSWYTSVAQFNNAINNWTLPTGGSTDIFNTALATTCYCSPFSTHASNPGQQAPRTGNGYCNIVTYGNGGCSPWREYLQGQLTTPLVVGTTYEVEMWVTLADKMSVGTNNIGVKFSTNPYTQASNCGYYTTPDLNYTGPIILDKQNWVQILFCYTPTTAGLDNFIIGNFYNDAATATAAASGTTTGNTIRYYVEDVRIEAVTPGGGDAGTNGAISLCSSDPGVDLFNSLGGTPDMTGTWSGPSTLGGGYLGTFDPSTNAAGTYTYSVTGGSGPCVTGGGSSSADVVVTLINNFDATITPVGPFCTAEPSITLSAVDPGGTWSGTGITNATTGAFDPATAGVGTHTITYTIPGACGDVQTTSITVNAIADATITPVGPFCIAEPALNLTAVDPGGTWSGTGITNATTGTFDPATAGIGTHTITYAIPGTCGDVQTTTITVDPTLDATITPVGPFCTLEPALNLTAVDPGGTWSGTGITNATTGTFDPTTAGAGTHTITYTIPGTCGDVQTTTITIGAAFDATITPAGPFCTTDPALQLTAVDAGGTWSGTGITNAVTGTFDPVTAGAGTHTITYTIPGVCGDVQTTNITVSTSLDATITPVEPFCANDPSLQLTAVDAGGTWTGTGITNGTNGTFDPATAGVGTHTITYTIPGSCGDVQTTNITINTVADASITPVGPYCVTDPSLQLTAVDAGGTWTGAGITNAATGTFDPVTAGVGTHTITYTIGGMCGDIQTTNIIVSANLNATITPVPPLCISDPAVQLTAVDPGGTWTGTGITDAVNGIFDPATAGAGTHSITYTITGNCGDVHTISIDVIPQADATITPAGPFCEQDPSVQLTAVDPAGTWSGTGITDPVNGTFDPVTAGTGSHSITYTIAGSCGDVQTTTIVVNALDDPGITAVGPFCLGSPAVTMVAATTPGTWSGTGITDPANGIFDITTAGSGSHVITYLTNDLCPNTGTTTIDILDPLSVAALQDETICDGETSDLSAAANGGDGNYTYTWTDQNAAVVGSGTTISVSPSVTTIYTVTVTDGCTTPSADDAVTITVIPIPEINFTVDNAISCAPLDVTFTNSSVPQGTNCQWNFGDGLTSTNCGSASHTYTDVGCYDVTLTVSENGCSNSMTQVNMVCVVDDPIADFTFTPESVDIFDPEFFFTNTSLYATSYSWDFDDGTLSSEENPTHRYAYEEGEYTICLTAYNDYNCVSEICKPVLVNEGLIYYMPNTFTPDGDEFNQTFQPIFTSGYDPQDFKLLIFDRWGEVIWESNDAAIGWDGTFNGKLVQSGTYVWKVEFKVLENDERMMNTGHVNVIR